MKRFLVTLVLLLLLSSSMIYAQDEVMFNYQGRVKVQGNPFTGSGQFKFVIINNAGNESLWSNDNTSTGGGEPVSSISISVTDGIFNAMIGDTSLGMTAINRSIFNHPNQIKLRIWFSDGTHGFQQLLPDHKLANVELLGMASGSDDFTIYVNGTTGNDEHNGLSPSKAKKTIQAAIDVLPERLKCNVTIDIADGIYREQVDIVDITVKTFKALTLLGDETWTPSSPGDPAVRITGTDNDVTHDPVRSYGIFAVNSYNIVIQGILTDYFSGTGIVNQSGYCRIYNSKSSNNGVGFSCSQNAKNYYTDCLATDNSGTAGFIMSDNCSSNMLNCSSLSNSNFGLFVDRFCSCIMQTNGKYSNNGRSGIYVGAFSRIWFFDDFTGGEIKDNSEYGMWVKAQSHASSYGGKVTITGNTAGDTYTDHEGYLWP